MTVASHILFRLVAALAIVLAAGIACAGMAHAQQPDDSYHHLMDLSIVSEYRTGLTTTFSGWHLEVENNNMGGPVARHVRVRIVFTDGNGDEETTIWNIYNLPPGESAKYIFHRPVFNPTNQGPAWAGVRLEARIIESDPVEPPGFQFNNATEHWAILARRTGRQDYNSGDTVVGVSISDRFPQAGGATTFTVHAASFHTLQFGQDSENNHRQFDVQVEISLSKGLALAGTQPQEPSGTMFDTSTGIWDVGVLESADMGAEKILSLPVAVDLSTDELADLPLEERCLTAEVVSALPWPSKRENDTATACLGDDPKVLLTSGAINLIEFYPCIGVTDLICTSADTLELVADARRINIDLPGFGRVDDIKSQSYGRTLLRPDAVLIHVNEPGGRGTKAGSVIWSTVDNLDLRDSQERLSSSWSVKESVTVTAPGGGNAPGRWLMTNLDDSPANNFDILDARDSSKVTYEFFDLSDIGSNPVDYFLDIKIDFWALGTYKALFEISGRLSGTTYTDSGTYTFHVGPISELEVRDAGANPAVAAGQSAYTIVAVNNGPDAAPAVQVTGLPTGVTEFFASDGSYGPASGVWTIGELDTGVIRRASGKTAFPTLTLVTDATAPITASIENTQDYCVRIKTGAIAPENDLECAAGNVPTGYTEHSTPLLDHIEGNNTATIAAHAGSAVGLSGPKGVKVVETPVGNIVQWEAVAEVNGLPVTHYRVQRSASPWTTVAENVKGTVYADMAPDSDNPQYRVRAVNEFDVPGPWSMAATPHLQPGSPKSLTAAGQSDTVAGLSWSAPDTVAGVTVSGYDLEFSKDGGATWASLATGQSATSYTHTDAALTAASLTPDILRQYRVRTVGTIDGSTVKSDWATATLAHPKPGVPATFAAAGQSETQASLSWSAPAAVTYVSISGYELGFSKDGGASWATVTGTPTLDGSTWSLTHSDNTLGADAVRQYRARTLGTVGSVAVKSGWAYALATEDYPAPGAPRNFAARAIDRSQVNLSWTVPEAVTGVTHTGYHLEFSSDGNTWTRLADDQARTVLPATATSHPHVNDALAPGALRQYRLRAVGTANNASFESGWVFASAATEAVGPPQNLAAAADGRNRIDLSWDPPAFGADLVTGYRIDYTPSAAEDWRTLEHGYRTSPRSYEHGGLLPGDRYCYRVAAIYAGGTGPFAARVCATTEGAPEDLPGEPQNLRVAQVGSNYVTLEWDPPSVGGKVEYYEWRSNIHDAKEVTPRTATSVTVSGLPTTSTYEFQVRAGNSYGPGGWSTSILVALHRAGSAVKASPAELEVEKGGSGSFNVRLNRSPQWPLRVYFFWEGPDCLTESLPYQQGQILLPTNLRPSKEFWEDFWWGPPEDRFAVPWNRGLDIHVDASGCQGGETAVVQYDLWSLPFSELEGLPMWEELNLNEEEWREKWGVDPLDGISGPSVKVTVVDGAQQRSRQSGPGVKATVSDTTPEQQQGPPNQPPTVSAAIADAALVNESGAHQVSLSGVFDDADGDSLTITAASSDEAVAMVSVSADYSSLTVTAKSRGTASITVTADDGNGGTVEDAFTVKVKAAPVVASAISDLGMEAEATQDIDLAGVFSDADGDALTITANTSDYEVVEAILFQGALTVIAVSDGSATVTVTAEDSDGNTVSDTFDVSVVGPPTPAENLRCIAETGRVAFLWDAPEWSGGETYAYDYELTLPGGRSEGGRLIGITTLLRTGEYQAGSEASVSVKTVYELADESEVYSAAETLTCTVGGSPPAAAFTPALGRRDNGRSGGTGNPVGRTSPPGPAPAHWQAVPPRSARGSRRRRDSAPTTTQ